MHISLRGLQQVQGHSNTFPYDAISPISGLQTTFSSIEDVYSMLLSCYQECIEKGFDNLGEALYTQAMFVVNDTMMLDENMQNLIKKYQFCKKFNAPPYPSLQDTPANIVESFMIIDDEIQQFSIKERNG